jgi:hypothetical protein
MTKHPAMPQRVAEIRKAIKTRIDYTVLRNGGREAVYAYGKACGLRWPNTLITSWSDDFKRTYDLSAWTYGRIERKNRPAVDDDGEPRQPDDPFDEPDDDEDTDDANDDSVRQRTKLCPQCRGTGRDRDGARCARCKGSGRVGVDDVRDGDKYGRYGIYDFLIESEE